MEILGQMRGPNVGSVGEAKHAKGPQASGKEHHQERLKHQKGEADATTRGGYIRKANASTRGGYIRKANASTRGGYIRKANASTRGGYIRKAVRHVD